MSVKTLLSMKSISPSNICALLAKWRYSAASLTSSRAASAAVVMRSAPGCSSISASTCRICTRRSPGLGRLRADHRAVGLVGQDLQQHGVRHAAVDDVHRVDAALGGVQRAGDLGQHAAADGAVGKQLVDAARRQVGSSLPALSSTPGDVGQHQQLLGLAAPWPAWPPPRRR
jgi:hypothetical protein